MTSNERWNILADHRAAHDCEGTPCEVARNLRNAWANALYEETMPPEAREILDKAKA